MDLNKEFCASDCVNLKCDINLSMRHVKAAEKQGIDLTNKHADYSFDCDDYVRGATIKSQHITKTSTCKNVTDAELR